jgi:biotin operon repressor
MEEEPGAAPSLRESNRLRVIQALQILGVTSRADVARRTGLSRSTVSTIVAALQAEGIVVDRDADGRAAAGGGRPPAPISLFPAAGLALGVDFGKRHLAVALADLSHELLAEEWREMPDDYDATAGM